MGSKYNPIVDTLISTPLVNLSSWTVASKLGQVPPVIVGTDDWEVPAGLVDVGSTEGLFLGQNVATFAPPPTVISVFNTKDRVRIKEITLHCNFADGLLDVSNKILAPVFTGGGGFPAGGYFQDRTLYVALTCYRIDSTSPQGNFINAGSITFSVPGFGLPLICDYQEPRFDNAQGIIAPITDKGFIFGAILSHPVGLLRPLFSTITIDPSFQNKRILVWAQIVVEHTFPLMFETAVT